MIEPWDDARRAGVACAAVVAVAVVALVALRRPPSLAPQWPVVDGPGFSVTMPVTPSLHLLDGGAAGADTAVVRDVAYTVVWFAVPAGTPPRTALSGALGRLPEVPATLITSRDLTVGPFAGTDVTARVASDYLHGRLLVIGRRAYLIAELAPTLNAPSDLNRLLVGFDPDATAG